MIGKRARPSNTCPTSCPPSVSHGVHHLRRIDAVAWPVDRGCGLIAQRGNVGLVVGLDVGRAGNRRAARVRSPCLCGQHLQVVAVEQHGDVGLDAGHQFVDPHFDRLREAECRRRARARSARPTSPRSVRRAFCAAATRRIGLSITQTSVWCTPITSLAISGRPVLQNTVFTSGNCSEQLLDLRRHGDRIFQRGAGQAARLRSADRLRPVAA